MHDLLTELLCEILDSEAEELPADPRLCIADGIGKPELARLILACERRYGVDIPDDLAVGWKRLSDLRLYLEGERTADEEKRLFNSREM